MQEQIRIKENCGIYRILNTKNNKSYVGSSFRLHERYIQHKNNLDKNKHPNLHLQQSYNKYGRDFFVFIILEICSIEHFVEKEQFYVDKHKSNNKEFGYNKRVIVESNRGHTFKMSQSSKEKLRKIGIERGKTVEFKSFMSSVHKNKIVSTETRVKNSSSQKGKVLSQKTKDKIGLNFKGKSLSQEHKNKISLSKKGIRTVVIDFTEEVRNKISQAKKKKIVKLSICGEELEVFNSVTTASKSVGLSLSSISKALKNKDYVAGGYKWKVYIS